MGAVSGTSISFGTPVAFEGANSDHFAAAFDSSKGRVVIAYRDVGNSDYGTVIAGSVNGTSITFDSPVVFNNANSTTTAASYDANSESVLVSFRDHGGSSYGKSVVYDAPYINRGQVADGAAATVDIVGTVSTNQIGLTAGQQYFVQTDGTVGLTAADPSVLAGTAISATKLVVKT